MISTRTIRKFMSLTIEYVNRFENLSTGNASAFFDNVADDVHWTVMGGFGINLEVTNR